MKRIAALAITCALAAPVYAQTVATVNGKAITQDQIDQFSKLLVAQGATESEELRQQIKEEMVRQLALTQAAEKAGLDKKENVRLEISMARQNILSNALSADYIQKNPISDADIQKEYDALKQRVQGQKEYKVRHILVKDEKEAKDLLAQIKSKKTNFADAAKKNSIDTGSGAQGGDLGWASSQNYVPEFATAVESLNKGQLADAPVQSQFGWHIIEVEDSRPVTFPELSAVKNEIKSMMTQRKVAEFEQQVVKDAKVN